MQSKKMWQAWGTIFAFLLLTAFFAVFTDKLFSSGKWKIPFGIGCAFFVRLAAASVGVGKKRGTTTMSEWNDPNATVRSEGIFHAGKCR